MLVKYAAAKIIETAERIEGMHSGPHNKSLEDHFGKQRTAAFMNRVAAADPSLLDPERFLYLRVRAVSDGEYWGPNDNGDYFGLEELSTRHGTFVYDPKYVDHNNVLAENAIGIVIASIHHPGPRPGGWVEIIAAIDRERASRIRVAHLPGQPDLLTAIKTGQITDTSMGCFVEYSICSVCGNVAADVAEYCPHIANFKGQSITHQGQKVPVYEDNRGVTFFENSIITTRLDQGGGGADLNAKILSEVAAAQKSKAQGEPWTRLIVDRRKLILEQERAMKENKKRAAAQQRVAGPDATKYQYAVGDEKKTTQVDTGDYFGPGGVDDHDQALFDQSQAKSKASGTPTVIGEPDEKLSQRGDDPDYPLPNKAGNVPEPSKSPDNISKTMSGRKKAEADPANIIGGKPDEVLDAEQDLEEAAAAEVEDKKDPEDIERTDEEMADRHEKEQEDTEQTEAKESGMTWGQRLRQFVGNLMGLRVADVPDGEGIRILQDYVNDAQRRQAALYTEIKASVSSMKKQALTGRVNAIQRRINKAIAVLGRAAYDPKFAAAFNRFAEQYGGNPQQLVDFEDIYEQGDPDHNLYEQSKGKSGKEAPVGVGDKEQVAEVAGGDRAQDHPPQQYGEVLSALKRGGFRRTPQGLRFEAGRIRIAGSEAAQMLDEIEDLMGPPQGLSYEEAQEKVLERSAKRIATRMGQKPRPQAQRQGAQAGLTGRRLDIARRLEALENGGDTMRRRSQEFKSDDEKMEEFPAAEQGNETEAMGRECQDFMTDEEVQGQPMTPPMARRQPRTARPEPYGGEDPRGGGAVDPEAKMTGGNADTLASPATRGEADPGEFVRSTDPPANRKPQPYQGQRRQAADFSVGQQVKWKPGAPYADPSEVGVIESIEGDSAEVDWGAQKGYVKIETTPLDYIDPVTARRRPIMAAEDPEDRFDAGTGPVLESPSTGDVAEDGTEQKTEEGAQYMQGTSMPPRENTLSMKQVFMQRLMRENGRLRAQQRRAAVEHRKREANGLVRSMIEKGMFVQHGNTARQRIAAQREFVRLCKLQPTAFAEAVRMVQAAPKGTRVAEWTRTVPLGTREGAVQRPVSQPARHRDPDETHLTTMFE